MCSRDRGFHKEQLAKRWRGEKEEGGNRVGGKECGWGAGEMNGGEDEGR